MKNSIEKHAIISSWDWPRYRSWTFARTCFSIVINTRSQTRLKYLLAKRFETSFRSSDNFWIKSQFLLDLIKRSHHKILVKIHSKISWLDLVIETHETWDFIQKLSQDLKEISSKSNIFLKYFGEKMY